MEKDWMQQMAENAEKAQYVRAVFSPMSERTHCTSDKYPDFRLWCQTLGLGSYLIPPAANLPPPPVLNEWERTQFVSCPF